MDEAVLKGFGVSATLFAGYIFLRMSPFRRYKAEHLRTDRFALHLLGFALFLYAVGVVVAGLIDREMDECTVKKILSTASEYTQLQASVLCSLAVAPIFGLLDRFLIALWMGRDPSVKKHGWKNPLIKTRAAAIARFVLTCDDASIRLLHRATFYRKPLLLTLNSGKVYVGQPVGGIGDPSVRSHSIKIIPLYSGYRNPDTHKVELPTRYTDVNERMSLREGEPANPQDPLARDIADLNPKEGPSVEVDMQDMGVVIFWSEIQTISLYDHNIYLAFQSKDPLDKPARGLLGKDGILARLLAAFTHE